MATAAADDDADGVDALLHSSGLRAVICVRTRAFAAYVLPAASASLDLSKPPKLLGAIGAGAEAERWRMLWTAVKRECPRATCLVRPVQVCVADAGSAPRFADGAGEHADAIVRMLRWSQTRACAEEEPSVPPASALPAPRVLEAFAAALATAVEASGGLASRDHARLLVVALHERWSGSRVEGGSHVACLQLEGFAPIAMREPLLAAARAHVAQLSSSDAAVFGALGPLRTRGVSWHSSAAQAALCALRWQRALSQGAPPPRDPPVWLEQAERLCAHADGGLLGLLHGPAAGDGEAPADDAPAYDAAADNAAADDALDNASAHTPPDAPDDAPSHAPTRGPAADNDWWRAGRTVLSSHSPRLEYYPSFLSPAESAHLLTLALAHAAPMGGGGSFGSGGGVSGSTSDKWRALPPTDDPVVRAVEERCAAATGVSTWGVRTQHCHMRRTPSSRVLLSRPRMGRCRFIRTSRTRRRTHRTRTRHLAAANVPLPRTG